MESEWVTHALRILAFTSLATGAYRGWKQLRAQGPVPMAAQALMSVILLAFIVSATMFVIFYFAFVWPDYVLLFLAGAAVYLIGGFRLTSWLLYIVDRRLGAGRMLARPDPRG